jgi:hypothetical protein
MKIRTTILALAALTVTSIAALADAPGGYSPPPSEPPSYSGSGPHDGGYAPRKHWRHHHRHPHAHHRHHGRHGHGPHHHGGGRHSGDGRRG